MKEKSITITDSLKKKLMSANEAVRMIPDGATVQIAGTALVLSPAKIFKNIGQSFLETGHPRDLCIFSYGSPSTNVPGYNYFEYLAHEGLVKRIISGHLGLHSPLFPLIKSNKVEGYNISQGILSIMTGEMVSGKKGYLTKVGLRTHQDPRYGGGKLNKGIETEDLVELRIVDGQEYLWFKIMAPDVTILKASYADLNGNISFEEEPSDNDALASAMAAKNNGGKVIVYVKALKEEYLNPRLAVIPNFLVDAIIVEPDHIQTAPGIPYNPYFSNELRCSEKEIRRILDNETQNSIRKRDMTQKIIARRATMELYPNAVVNIGYGIPQMISGEAIRLGVDMDSVVMTTEIGIIGGITLPSVFGVAMNADSIYDQASQFRFYEGGGLDIGFLGALEMDSYGNINVFKKGSYLAGVGGFNFIVHSAKKLVFCFSFMRGSGFNYIDGKLVPYNGKDIKLVKEVESISMNAKVEFENNKTLIYITERCVFQLKENGIEITEIAPGLDLKKDILDLLDFTPLISKNLKEMPAICFEME